MGKYLFVPLAAFVFLGLTGDDASAQQCMGVGCNAQNTCSGVKAGPDRNCCCQPQCGPEGCYACTQSCMLSCAFTSCPSCDDPLCGSSPAAETFAISQDSIRTASKVHRMAGIILQSRSSGGTVPIRSEFVTGGTNIFGDQIRFSANILADKDHLSLEITFHPWSKEAEAASLPEPVRFLMERSGRMTVVPLPPEARVRIDEMLASRQVPCAVMVAAAAFTIH